MTEANGAACGYPNVDGGGYLLVIQFQPLARWSSYADSDQAIGQLAHPAVQNPNGSEIYVRDEARGATVMFLASGGGSGRAEALHKIAAIAYPPSG